MVAKTELDSEQPATASPKRKSFIFSALKVP